MVFRSLLIIYFTFMVFTGFCQYQSDTSHNNKFERDISQALKLKFINRDSAYQSMYARIINDTIVGVQTHMYNNPPGKYFIQSLNNVKTAIRFDKPKLMNAEHTYIDDYRNGQLYFAEWGGGNMFSLNADGQFRKFVNKGAMYSNWTNKVMLYKQMAILMTPQNVVAFDLNSNEMIWKHDILEQTDELSTIIDNKLYFTESVDKSGRSFLNLFCFNLDNFKLEWKKSLKGLIISPIDDIYQVKRHLRSDNGHLFIPALSGLYIVDQKNGNIKNVVQWNTDFEFFSFRPIYKVQNDTLFVSDDQNLYCKNVLTNKVIWSIKNLKFHALFRGKVIAYTKEDDYYYIINSKNGAIENKVAKTRYTENLIVIDNYVMINRMALYK